MQLTVSASAIAERLGNRPFVALPAEEIARHYAMVDVVSSATAETTPLHALAAFHHNFAWLVCGASLVRTAPLKTDGAPPLFLDEAMTTTAQQLFAAAVPPGGLTSWRLAGLVQSAGVALLFVGQLKQRPEGTVRGPSELARDRNRYDARSRIVIDHLIAL